MHSLLSHDTGNAVGYLQWAADFLAVIAQLEALLFADDPLVFQQEERTLLGQLEAQVAVLLNHQNREVQLMAGGAVVRLLLPDENALSSADIPQMAQELLDALLTRISDPSSRLMVLLESISDEESWGDIQDTVATAAAMLVSHETPLMPTLFQALSDVQDWPHRDPVLGTMAKLAELSPALLNAEFETRAELADKLLEYCSDLTSFNTRRFALTALSHLRRISPDLGQALLYCCLDVFEVRQAAIEAAKRFQHLEPTVLNVLVPSLTGSSVNTAYTVTLLLRELGRVSRRRIDRSQLLEQIAGALAAACVHPESGRIADEADQFRISGETNQPLADVCYEALIQVKG